MKIYNKITISDVLKDHIDLKDVLNKLKELVEKIYTNQGEYTYIVNYSEETHKYHSFHDIIISSPLKTIEYNLIYVKKRKSFYDIRFRKNNRYNYFLNVIINGIELKFEINESDVFTIHSYIKILLSKKSIQIAKDFNSF